MRAIHESNPKKGHTLLNIPDGIGRWRIPKPSITHILTIALVLSLAVSGYLFSRPDVRALVFLPVTEKNLVLTTTPPVISLGSSAAVELGLASTQTSASTEINDMAALLQDMQSKVLVTTIQLEQKKPVVNFGSSAQIPLAGDELPALLAEIDQLYQIMQPLMVQLEVANKSASSRPASEWAALRTQLNTIHQRLIFLITRVEAVKSRTNMPSSFGTGAGATQLAAPAGSTANMSASERTMYEQLYQTMVKFQSILQQMSSNGQPGR